MLNNHNIGPKYIAFISKTAKNLFSLRFSEIKGKNFMDMK